MRPRLVDRLLLFIMICRNEYGNTAEEKREYKKERHNLSAEASAITNDAGHYKY